MTLLYDLNVAWSPSTSSDQLLQLLSLASSLGYSTVALNHTLSLPLPANPVAPFPPASSIASAAAGSQLPAILYRATLPLADPAASNYRLPALAAAYDLLAIRPLTDKAFQNACLTLDVPLISLDLTQHFPFHFRPKPCSAAVARGVRFELCYAQALAADARGRANWIANAASLIRATRGRGLLISSEARDALSMRAPADVVNLLSVWGLSSDRGMQGIGSIPRAVVVNEGIKRTGFRGVIDVVEVAQRDGATQEGDADVGATINGGGKKNKNNKNKGNNAQSQGQGGPNQKRKGGDEEAQAVSKRQTKKMKLASRNAAAPEKAS